jgi:hypothetical protein
VTGGVARAARVPRRARVQRNLDASSTRVCDNNSEYNARGAVHETAGAGRCSGTTIRSRCRATTKGHARTRARRTGRRGAPRDPPAEGAANGSQTNHPRSCFSAGMRASAPPSRRLPLRTIYEPVVRPDADDCNHWTKRTRVSQRLGLLLVVRCGRLFLGPRRARSQDESSSPSLPVPRNPQCPVAWNSVAPRALLPCR